MSQSYSEQDLRQRTRALLAEVDPDDPAVDRARFRGAQYDHGLAWVHFPDGLGGLDLPPAAQAIVNDEIQKNAKTFYSDMSVNAIGIGMGAPTVLTYANDELKKRLLRPLFTGEEIWCQLFSEPGAGSDVASLATRAVRDGDEWVVNGQKVWTSVAHVSRWGMLLARCNPEVPKHDGLIYFVIDMHAPGVEIRPLYQITGEAEFNEVFLTDVRIPHDHMLGKEGQGWRVAITTLMNERVAIGGSPVLGGGRPIDQLLKLWRAREKRGGAREAVMRDRIVDLWTQAELLTLTNRRARAAMGTGNPGPEGSVAKLVMADLNKEIYSACLDVMGEDALVYEPGYARRRPGEVETSDPNVRTKYWFLRSRANSIEGGTSEVMRNILGERVLGLPGEPRIDKDRPWSEVPRG
jgi:alkylation response protein AidB-like acyl-CoA dehydrogenase